MKSHSIRNSIAKTANRMRLLYGYAAKQTRLSGAPVEYLVETTAKCNLYCPMCPRETHPQPKADMADVTFDAFIRDAGRTTEHIMLVGLGEPFLDPKIFKRIEYCAQHKVSTLLSTNGTLLDEMIAEQLLAGPLEHITLSFDGATKESFEFYRKGARYEKVRDNFVRLARMKAERGAKLHIVVQMVVMSRNAGEVDDFTQFWSAVPGVDQVRVKADETNLFQLGHAPDHFKYPCHYLWRGPMYVKQTGDVYPCCQSYMLDGDPVGKIGEQTLFQIWNSDDMQRLRELHVAGRAAEVPMCAKCCSPIAHPSLVMGSLVLDGRTVRRAMPVVERLVRAAKLPRKWLVAARN